MTRSAELERFIEERAEGIARDEELIDRVFFQDPLNNSLDELNEFFYTAINQLSETAHPYFTSEKGATLAEDVALVEHLEPLAEWALEHVGEWTPGELTMRDALEHVERAQGIRDRFTPGLAALDKLFVAVSPYPKSTENYSPQLKPLRTQLAVLRRLREEALLGQPVKHLFLEEWKIIQGLSVPKLTGFPRTPNLEELELTLLTEVILEDEGE